MSEQNDEGGFFENALMVIGAISGGIFGFEHGDWLGMIMAGLLLGAIGKWVGEMTDALFKLAFILIAILLNNAIRNFFWELMRAAFS